MRRVNNGSQFQILGPSLIVELNPVIAQPFIIILHGGLLKLRGYVAHVYDIAEIVQAHVKIVEFGASLIRYQHVLQRFNEIKNNRSKIVFLIPISRLKKQKVLKYG